MKIRNICLMFISLCLLVIGRADTGNVKQVGEGKYLIENNYFKIDVITRGGGIEGIIYKPKSINLTSGLADFKQNDISFQDRIYNQKRVGDEKILNLDYFSSLSYKVNILKSEGKEVSLEVSAKGLSDFFPGIEVSKVYTLKDNVPAIFVEHKLKNVSGEPVEAGIWLTTYFRIAGRIPERNKFYAPSLEGLEEVLHPGKDALPDGNWVLYPSSNWKGVLGDNSKVGLVAIFEYPHLSSFFNWFTPNRDVSTFEWVIKQQKIKPQSVFSTKYILMPVTEFNRLDNVMDSRLACGINFQSENLKKGEEAEIRYNLSSYENEEVKATVRIKSDGKVVTERTFEKVKLEAGKSFAATIKQKISKEGIYWAEVELTKDKQLVGKTERPLVVGNYEIKKKIIKGNPEETFWLGLKGTKVPEWQDLKFNTRSLKSQSDAEVVEQNIVTMGDFEEKDVKKYTKWYFNPGMTLTSEASHSGKQSLKMIVPEDYNSITSSFGTPLLKVEGGKEYKVTFWAKATDASGTKPTTSPDRFWYVLYPCGYYYKGDLKSPKYINRYCDMIKTPTFDWKKIEKIITTPEDAEWIRFSITTRATMGDIYVDDISISPVTMSAKSARKERAYLNNKSLDAFFRVSEEYVTPHTKWLKPYAKGKIKVLFMSSMSRLDDINKRDVVELSQRLDMDYKYIPLLSRSDGKADFRYLEGKELEPYIYDVVQEEIKKDYDLIVVNKLDCKLIKEELSQDLLREVRKGKGLLLVGCKNIPEKISELLTKTNLMKTPDDFLNMPEVNKTTTLARQVPQISKIWQLDKGKICTIHLGRKLYPCVPGNRFFGYQDYYGREIPYWEYMYFPLIKSIVSVAGKESDVKINNFIYKDGALNSTISSDIESEAVMEVVFNNIYGQAEATGKYPVKLKTGNNEMTISLPVLPGGYHISDYILKNSKGLIYDFGSYGFNIPIVSEIKEVKFVNPNRYYRTGEDIKVEIELGNIEEGCSLNWYVEDTYDRVIQKGSQQLSKGKDKATIDFKIDNPLTILSRLFVNIEKNNVVIHKSMGEFTTPFNMPPNDEFVAYGWFSFQGSHAYKAWKEKGFDTMACSAPRFTGLLQSLISINQRPCLYGLLYRVGDPDKGWRYRGDLGKEADDIIRKPCFSDPNWWKKIEEEVDKDMYKNVVYYGIKDYLMGDECFLGTNVCFSEWCLKDFRDYLKKHYKDLNELNKTWKSGFKSWEEVVPSEKKNVKAEENNLAAWLDHKMFMTTVFAKIGKRMKEIVEKKTSSENIRMGYTGSQNVGFTYNWWELMKYNTCWLHYTGMQEDLIRSYRPPDARYGLCVGYAPEHADAEKYSRHSVWARVFNEENCLGYYHGGYAMLGDLSFARNTKYVLEELKELQQGIDKSLLSSELVCDIGIHNSQSSMFTSIVTIGKNLWSKAVDSWSAIIDDLGVNFKFVSYEQLEKEGLDKNKYKVFILPVSLSMSEKETEALRKYVESGGILISDFGAGMYNQHGLKINNKRLLDIFGIERESDNNVACGGLEIKISGIQGVGLEKRDAQLRFGEIGLKLTTGKAYGETGESRAPAVIINKLGKGKAIFLNCVMSDYAQVTLSGVGGELSEVKKGVLEVNEQTKGLVRNLFEMGGVVPDVEIKTDKGVDLQSVTKTSIWRNGEISYVGFLNTSDNMSSSIKPSEITSANIFFRKKGYLYDMNERKYIGEISGNKPVNASITPSKAKIYAILPYRVNSLDIRTDKKKYKAGDTVKVSVKIRASGRQLGNHVAYMEVYGPDKKARSYYAKRVILKNGEGVLELPTAFNDDAGLWSIMIRDVASGVSKKVNITLAK